MRGEAVGSGWRVRVGVEAGGEVEGGGRSGRGGVGGWGWGCDYHVGAAEEIRTPDQLITNQLLYQLSYGGGKNELYHFSRPPAAPTPPARGRRASEQDNHAAPNASSRSPRRTA